ncbi:UNVERIFIED_ORG: hypothetical protein HNP28_001861 [Comamonas terrigena]
MPQAIAHRADRQAQALLALAQGILQGLVLGHVQNVAVPQQGAILFRLGLCMAMEPADPTIGTVHPVLVHPSLAPLDGLRDGGPQAGHVVGVHPAHQGLQITMRHCGIDAVHGIKAGIGEQQHAIPLRIQAILKQPARHFLGQPHKALLALQALVFLAPAQKGQPGRQHRPQENQRRSQTVAPQALFDGLVQRIIDGLAVQSGADQYRVVMDTAPGIHALDAIWPRDRPVAALHGRSRTEHGLAIRGHLAPQHLFLALRARKVGAVIAQQQDHIARIVINALQLLRQELRRQRKHQHPRKLPMAVMQGSAELDAPLLRHPALDGLADIEAGGW